MKTITFFTTFHKPGFDLYGKHWLATFIRNVRKKNPNISARVYTEGIEESLGSIDRIEILDFDRTIPDHAAWESRVRSSPDLFWVPCPDVMRETVRFSHKAFVMQHALNTITTDYAVWVDADCIFHDASYEGFPQNILGDNFLACQLEVQPGDCGNHIESGVLFFDMHHPDTVKFAKGFADNYKLECLKKFVRPFDGYVINRTLEEMSLSYTNLNEHYGVPGIQGDTTATFRHPEIAKRFKHNIGAYGKSDYKDWDNVKNADENFQHLNNHIQTFSRY